MYSSISVLLIQPHRVKQATVSLGQDTALPWRDYSLPLDNTLQITYSEAQISDEQEGTTAWFGKEIKKSKF